MKLHFVQLITFLLFVAVAEGFALPAARDKVETRKRVHRKWDPLVFTISKPTKMTTLRESTSSSSVSRKSFENSNRRSLPTIFYKLNSSSKWLVTLANTLGIWCRLPHFEGPFIVVGAIAAVYFTDALKQILNHDRPDGAPFTDPGMPSSHSLVSFFMAAAWGCLVSRGIGVPVVWAGASSVALLRVICGYHSWDQIGVGAMLGSSMGFAWAKLGSGLHKSSPGFTLQASWGLYVAGSLLFIFKNTREWLQKEKHL